MENKDTSFRGLGILSMAVICLTLGSLTVPAIAASPKVPSHACEQLLTSMKLSPALQGVVSGADLSKTQIERLQALLDNMAPAERDKLLKSLGEMNLDQVKAELAKDGPSKLDAAKGTDLSVLFLMDFISLNDAFPGIFSQANPAAAVFKVLKLGREVEVGDKLKHPDLLKSIGLTSRFKGSLDSSLANLIQQAEVDYLGMRFPEQPTGFGRAWYRIKRFMFPLHNRVASTIEWSQDIQRQLQRVRMVDQLIVRLALSEAQSLKLSNEEVDRLLRFVINSPEEINDIEKLVQKVFGKDLKINQSKQTGTFDIHGLGSRTANFEMSVLHGRFDKINIDSLDEMDAVLSEARVRQGAGARTPKDYVNEELQIRIEASLRGLFRHAAVYRSYTEENSNERYTVEESYTVTRTEPDGNDANGNPQTKTVTETHYRDRSVTPTFENILSGSYDTGDRGVTGLSDIKNRASDMVEAEGVARNIIASAESQVVDVQEKWYGKSAKGEGSALLAATDKMLAYVVDQIPKQQAYAKWSNQKIKAQYDEDSVENFRNRNAKMLDRLVAAEEALTNLREAIRRDLPQLTPKYELFGFDQWLTRLRSIRNRNYAVKTGLVGLTAGGTSLLSTDVQMFLFRHGVDVQMYVDQIRHLLP